MGRRGEKQKPARHRVDERHISPDDVLHLLQERDQLAALDTRTDLEKFFGDPPPGRSALAQRNQVLK